MTSKLSLMEKDLQLLEQEKENLLHKAELLQKALDSPNSRAVLKRVLERLLLLPCCNFVDDALCPSF